VRKKFFSKFALITLAILVCVGLGGGLILPAKAVYANALVTFPDPNLEAVIREAITKPMGDIYQSDVEWLTTLNASSKDIADLTGLENCVSLQTLYLWNNHVSDISALQNLTFLTTLYLGNNQISDISALQNLTNLQNLYLDYNQISDISPLAANGGLGFGDTINLRHNLLDITPGSLDMNDINKLLTRNATVYFLPQDAIPVPTQTWYLDSATDASGNPIMENSGTQSDSVLVGGTTTVWLSNLQATTPVVFDDGIWVVQLDTSDLTGPYSVEIGSSEGGHGFSAFHTPVRGIASGSPITLYISLPSVFVPQDTYLALRISSTGTGSITTIGNSYLGAPGSSPSYPVPEMATIALFALGLSGLAFYIYLKIRKEEAESDKKIC
jgi:Leucine-rich repeat (LRR) protein